MVKWSLRSFLSASEVEARDEVGYWFATLPWWVRADIRGHLSVARSQPLEFWREDGLYKPLTGRLTGLDELKFDLRENEGGVRESYRVLGFAEEALAEFTMLVGFKKTRGPTDYEEFGPIAQTRMAQVRRNRTLTIQSIWLENYD